MTRDDILRMAREAGFPFNKYGLLTADDEGEIDADAMLERFAVLVAAAEREACAKLCEDSINLEPYPTLTKMAAAIRAQAADRLARHGIQIPEDDDGNPSF
jgi:hypothetical protein